jgi:hypothetical protein
MNFGIHDCCLGRNVTQAQYIRDLGAIYGAAHAALAPDGKIVWVSTTPVPTVGTAPQPFTCHRSGASFNGRQPPLCSAMSGSLLTQGRAGQSDWRLPM